MTLSERQRAWAESPVRRIQKLSGDLRCGAGGGACLMQECVFYDPTHDECIHVLQAQAQIGIAESLAQMVQDAGRARQELIVSIAGADKVAEQAEPETGDIRGATEKAICNHLLAGGVVSRPNIVRGPLDWCQFCKVKARCKTRAEAMQAAAGAFRAHRAGRPASPDDAQMGGDH